MPKRVGFVTPSEGMEIDWKTKAVCRTGDYPPDTWWPTDPIDAWLGVALCHTCPVMALCRADAAAHHDQSGTWGGLSEWDRAELAGHSRRRSRTANEEFLAAGQRQLLA